jgi:mRNA-degrading endonuclease RelE of RelBE toxin-antitoxin system
VAGRAKVPARAARHPVRRAARRPAHYGAEYRVRYEIDEDERVVVVLRFDHRSGAYGR